MKVYLLVIGMVLTLAGAVSAQDVGRLTVVGQGRIESLPDMATINLSVTTEARTAEAALARNSKDMAQILVLITAQSIADKDVQTSGLNLSPVWNSRNLNDGGRPSIVGYSVSNRLTIRVRDLDRLGEILDAAVKTGATQFNGLQFGLQDPEPALDNARVAAVKDAVRKAKLYANAAGIELGVILQLNEAGVNFPGPVPQFERGLLAQAVPIARGEVATTASVSIVYEIVR